MDWICSSIVLLGGLIVSILWSGMI